VCGGVEPPPPTPAEVRLLAWLPKPDRRGEGREQATMHHGEAEALQLDGWKFRGRARHQCKLSGIVAAHQLLTITIRAFPMPLNNSDDEVSLLDRIEVFWTTPVGAGPWPASRAS
jgi:hypothetical protein